MTDMFFFGTLCDRRLLDIVLGHDRAVCTDAELPDYAVHWVQDEAFPILVPQSGASAKGVLCQGLSPGDVARLHYYEAGFDYETQMVDIRHAKGVARVEVYFAALGAWTPGAAWDLTMWQAKYAPAIHRVASQIMQDYRPGNAPIGQHRQLVLGQRAQARVAALGDPTPLLDGTPNVGGIQVLNHDHPYDTFFAVEDVTLRIPRFDDQPSEPVLRSVFVSADAVSVLPYDPVTDRVLLVEQFRIGPYMREDANPWQLEPVAGRVDEGETYTEAAIRELAEETGTSASQLIEIGGYYTSPGTLMEYLTSFVALTDLPEPGTWLGGLSTEHEDIRSHVLSYAGLVDLQTKGHLRNGPLLVSVGWLALNRDRLRADAHAAAL